MNRKNREELNDLSKQCFGTTSRWQKIVDNGVAEVLERDREVMVPAPNRRGLVKKVFTDKRTVIKRYTEEGVRDMMVKMLEARSPTVVKA